MLVDTSILIPIFRDASGRRRDRFRKFLRGRDFVLTRFTQLELLRGCASETQWQDLSDYLDVQEFAEAATQTWSEAARIHFELRRKGTSITSIYDCCIAEIAMRNRLTILHNDRDFELIRKVRPLRLHRLDIQSV
jgi:predicted nucleic acid-binding protein